MAKIKPMLAHALKPSHLKRLGYPMYVQPKLDGIRCLAIGGQAVSRTLKPLPNKYVQSLFTEYADELEGLDGELVVGSPTATDAYRVTASGVMSQEGEPEFTYWVYDRWDRPEWDYWERAPFDVKGPGPVCPVDTALVENEDDVLMTHANHIRTGYEGIILRKIDGLYKYGRSTLPQEYLLKYKHFEDAEAVVIGFEERMHNANDLQQDELGYAKRSSAKGGLVPTGTLGALVCMWPSKSRDWADQEVKPEETFRIGTGFTEEDRVRIWERQHDYYRKLAKFKYFATGDYNLPRFPVFLGWRSRIDV